MEVENDEIIEDFKTKYKALKKKYFLLEKEHLAANNELELLEKCQDKLRLEVK